MDPLQEYTSRRDRWRADHTALDATFRRIGNWRLAVVGAAVFLLWLAFWRGAISGWWLLAPLAGFIALIVWHERVVRRRAFAERAVRHYERGLARLSHHWAGTGNTGEQFRDGSHVYAEDLDVFGKGSLFELVAAARTEAGEQTLANWFLSPATREEVLLRQEAVRELRDSLNLREDVALLGEEIRASLHAEALGRWGSAPPVGFTPLLRWLALVLSLAGVVALIGFFAHVVPLWPLILIVSFNFALMVLLRKRVAAVIEGVETPAEDLQVLSLLLERLEQETFHTKRLKELRAALDIHGLPASRRIARLKRWMELLDSREHLLMRLVRPLLLWDEQLAMAVECWRCETGSHIGKWLAAIGELEALLSLASLAFERPQWSFPILTEGAEPRFEAEGLQHPLLPPEKCVPNDVKLGGDLRLLIVSGSNMSGKSTLLRAMGLNTVLAWAGAPVAAKQLRVSPLQLGVSIRVTDSLQDGRSRFYAEITRIRQVMDLAGAERPLLFLLDELLSGTNSHDRRIGASAIVLGLVRRGAIGLITTHDLALANLEQDLGPQAKNVHFEDAMIDGRIEFDYRLRPGVVTRSNALELMRAVGLEV